MKGLLQIVTPLLNLALIVSACTRVPADRTGPTISNISTSAKVIAISDCLSTSVTIAAKVNDPSDVARVLLWYRVASDERFAFTNMSMQNGVYTATVKGSDLQGHGYGPMEFYITAEDGAGNDSKSEIDNSVQFLPCVSS